MGQFLGSRSHLSTSFADHGQISRMSAPGQPRTSCAAQKASYSITSSARGRLSSPFAIGRQAPLCAVAFLAQKIHERLERRPHLAAARIIKEKSCRRSWRPFVQRGHKPALGEIRCDEDGRPLYKRKAFGGGRRRFSNAEIAQWRPHWWLGQGIKPPYGGIKIPQSPSIWLEHILCHVAFVLQCRAMTLIARTIQY